MAKRIQENQNFLQRFIHRKEYRQYYKKTTAYILTKPFTSFFIALFLLFFLIVVGNILSRPKAEKTPVRSIKAVSLYTIGQAPKATFQAKIDKPGVIKIVALSGGVIENIGVSEGDSVNKGDQLFTLSTDYQGGNAPAIQAQIAQDQYKNVLDTFDGQTSVIQKQKDLANINHDNFSETQNIATQSASDTNNLINANQSILDLLNQQLSQSQNSGSTPASLIPQETQINQLQAGQNQLRQSLANLQELTQSGKAPGRLADTQRDLALQQLDLQQKSLELNKEVSKLQAEVADINAATMFPVSPFNAVVEKVYVRIGEQVSQGTPLAELSSTDSHVSVIVDVPQTVATNISPLDQSTLYAGSKSYSISPVFIPTEATNGSLYSILYPLPDDLQSHVSDGEYIKIDIPAGRADTSAAVPFIPLDAIYQTEDSSFVLLDRSNTAVAAKVTIGQIYGSYVEITSGLRSEDLVILNRNVIAGDRLKTN